MLILASLLFFRPPTVSFIFSFFNRRFRLFCFVVVHVCYFLNFLTFTPNRKSTNSLLFLQRVTDKNINAINSRLCLVNFQSFSNAKLGHRGLVSEEADLSL